MFLKVSAKWMVRAAIALVLFAGLGAQSFAQQSRPRYSSRADYGGSAVIPAGTVISMRMDQTLNSKTSRVGDRFTATVASPVSAGRRTVIPVGTKVEGRVTQVTPARRMSKPGTIAIDFDSITLPDGRRVNLVGRLTSNDPGSRGKIDDEGSMRGNRRDRDAIFVGAGGAIGAVLGGILAGGKGAVLGGVAGAGIGVATVLLSKGEEAEVPVGSPFGIELQQSLSVGADPSFDNTARGNDPRDNNPPDNNPPDNDPRDNDPRDNNPRGKVDGSRPNRDSDPAYGRPDRRNSEPRDNPERKVEPQPTEPDHSGAEPVGSPDSDPQPEAETTTTEPATPAEQLPLSSAEMIRRAQVALKEQGYYEGQVDGVMSPRTSNALKTFQRENKLQETGDLDPTTANKLGITTAASVAVRRETRPAASAERGPGNTKPTDNLPADRVLLANVLSATADRTGDGALHIVINTQANTGGWRWFGEQVANGDTLEVYARAVKPTGVVTQALTRGKIELNVRERVDFIRRVVVHGAGSNITIPLGSTARQNESGYTRPGGAGTVRTSEPQPASNSSIQQRAEQLLADYKRLIGLRSSGSQTEIDPRYGDAEIEILFALDSFANAARLYSGLIPGIRDRQSARSATLALAKEARKTDRVITTTSSSLGDQVNRGWDVIRLEVLKLIRTYGISSNELDN